ncbi:NAD-dependent epimerase/dehydratase family protein [Thermopolyspora sp. NPDC052614]|uniref:NAD-dependent epimerase/dehydratase family protein n=1 Tax=Thermopolyspora sp. NPDC052614 TaxID=3155682 RepID=UPI00342BD58F
MKGVAMKVVVTGGAGFIGAHLCRELAMRPGVSEVVAFDDLSSGSAENLKDEALEDCGGAVRALGTSGGEVRLVRGSVLEREHLEEVLDGADAVVHLAACPSVTRSMDDPAFSHRVNATGTVRLLEVCRSRKELHLVAASSSSVYGSVSGLPEPEGLSARPLSPYSASKLAAEAYVLAYGAGFGLPTLALRFFNVYGPLQRADKPHAAVVPTFVAAALRRRPLCIKGDGLQTRDFTYVGTVARVLADAVVRRVTCPAPVNLAFGERVSLLELAHLVGEVVGVPVDIRHEPPRPGDIRNSQPVAGTLLRRLFPDVAPVSLRTGLEQTVAWLRKSLDRESTGLPV